MALRRCGLAVGGQGHSISVCALDDLKLAPFHLLGSEHAVHVDKDHRWQMQTLAELCAADDPLHPTAHVVVDMTDPESERTGSAWWNDLTAAGGEGMVVKPLEFLVWLTVDSDQRKPIA